MKMKNCIPSSAIFLLNLANYVKIVFKEAFTRLGLLKPPPLEEDYYSANHYGGYFLVMGSRSRCLVPVPVQVLTAMIKNNVPVLEYGKFIERYGDNNNNNNNRELCTVCLDSMGKSDEMRELSKCSHVFHKECLDTRVNEGQVTCPLCTSTLYPQPIHFGRVTQQVLGS